MSDFFAKIAGILEVGAVQDGDDLKAFPQWDSLAVLSVIAMLDADYGVNLKAADIQQLKTVGQLWAVVESKKT
jgi:acyl carrier protein